MRSLPHGQHPAALGGVRATGWRRSWNPLGRRNQELRAARRKGSAATFRLCTQLRSLDCRLGSRSRKSRTFQLPSRQNGEGGALIACGRAIGREGENLGGWADLPLEGSGRDTEKPTSLPAGFPRVSSRAMATIVQRSYSTVMVTFFERRGGW